MKKESANKKMSQKKVPRSKLGEGEGRGEGRRPQGNQAGCTRTRCTLRDRVRTTKQVLTEACLVWQRDRWALALRSQR